MGWRSAPLEDGACEPEPLSSVWDSQMTGAIRNSYRWWWWYSSMNGWFEGVVVDDVDVAIVVAVVAGADDYWYCLEMSDDAVENDGACVMKAMETVQIPRHADAERFVSCRNHCLNPWKNSSLWSRRNLVLALRAFSCVYAELRERIDQDVPFFSLSLSLHYLTWWMSVCFITSTNSTIVRFIRCVHMLMFFAIGTIGKASLAELTLKRPFSNQSKGDVHDQNWLANARDLPRVGSFVYFQIFRTSEDLAAPSEWTCEWLFTGVHPNMIDQFVFGFERSSMARTIEPQTCVCCLFRSAHMFYSQMSD